MRILCKQSEKHYFQRSIMEGLKVQMFIHPVTLETQVSLMTWILRLVICFLRLFYISPSHNMQGKYVVSTRIRCGRSVQGYPFNPNMTEQQYIELEDLVSSTLKVIDWLKTILFMLFSHKFQEMTGDHEGVYYPLTGMSKEVQQQLIDDHFLFKVKFTY